MIYSVEHLVRDAQNAKYLDHYTGRYRPARPLWSSWGRWRHAWWVFTGKCDAVWWPEDGHPAQPNRVPRRGTNE